MRKEAKTRTCVICKNEFNKDDLLRFIKTPDEELMFDCYGKAPARGTYVCSDDTCLDKAINKKVISKMLKIKQPDNLLEVMDKALLGKMTRLMPLLKKSNGIAFGADTVMDLMRKNKVSLVILASDISDKSAAKIEQHAENFEVNLVRYLDKATVDSMTNRANCVAFGFLGRHLAKNAIKVLKIHNKIIKYLKNS